MMWLALVLVGFTFINPLVINADRLSFRRHVNKHVKHCHHNNLYKKWDAQKDLNIHSEFHPWNDHTGYSDYELYYPKIHDGPDVYSQQIYTTEDQQDNSQEALIPWDTNYAALQKFAPIGYLDNALYYHKKHARPDFYSQQTYTNLDPPCLNWPYCHHLPTIPQWEQHLLQFLYAIPPNLGVVIEIKPINGKKKLYVKEKKAFKEPRLPKHKKSKRPHYTAELPVQPMKLPTEELPLPPTKLPSGPSAQPSFGLSSELTTQSPWILTRHPEVMEVKTEFQPEISTDLPMQTPVESLSEASSLSIIPLLEPKLAMSTFIEPETKAVDEQLSDCPDGNCFMAADDLGPSTQAELPYMSAIKFKKVARPTDPFDQTRSAKDFVFKNDMDPILVLTKNVRSGSRNTKRHHKNRRQTPSKCKYEIKHW